METVPVVLFWVIVELTLLQLELKTALPLAKLNFLKLACGDVVCVIVYVPPFVTLIQ